jgi:hypothetical protein
MGETQNKPFQLSFNSFSALRWGDFFELSSGLYSMPIR